MLNSFINFIKSIIFGNKIILQDDDEQTLRLIFGSNFEEYNNYELIKNFDGYFIGDTEI